MKILIALIVNLFVFGCAPSVSVGDAWDEVLTEAHNLAKAMLNIHNQQSGIEHLGGPFRFEDYKFSVRNYDIPNQERITVKYVYKQPNGIQGFPDRFDIFVKRNLSWPLKKNEIIAYKIAEIDVVGEFSSEEIKEILKVLPAFDDTYSEPNEPPCLVKIDRAGEIIRNYQDTCHIHSIMRLSSDKVQVFYKRSYKSPKFENIVSLIGADFTFELTQNGLGEIYLPKGVTLSEQPLRTLQKSIIQFGKINDKDLLEVMEISHRIPRLYPIAAVYVDAEYEYVACHAVDVMNKDIFPFGVCQLKQPVVSVTLEKENGIWTFKRQADIMNFAPMDFAYDRFYFPLLTKPSPQFISQVISKAKIDDSIDNTDAVKICEIVLRLHRIDYRILNISMSVEKPGYVELYTGTIAGGNKIELKKINNIWVVTNIWDWIG